MAATAVLQYLGELYSQSSFYNLSSYKEWLNTSRQHNASLLPTYESTELISLQDDPSELPMSAAHFGLATGLLAILLNSRLLSFKVLKTDARVSECQQWAEALLPRILLALLCLFLSASLVPLVALVFLFLALYRQLVHTLLSLTNPSFAALLDGTDAVWALEEDTSRSIINILAFFEVEIVDNVFKPQLLGMLRRLMRERILSSPQECPKFWQYRRRSRLGYFYWESQEDVRVEDHVQYMTHEDDLVNLEAPDLSEDSFRQEYYGMSESVLKGLVSELANSPLPYDNAASWEILVGRDPILEDFSEMDPFQAMEEGNPEASGRFRRYPVLFRVHHSMGDGVALVKLLLETLADKQEAASSLRNITATQILGYDNEETTRLTQKKILSRLDSIDLIKCSTGSSDENNHSNDSKVKRPNFLDLSPTSLEHAKKKVIVQFLGQDTSGQGTEGLESYNILYTKSPKSIDSPTDCDEDDQVTGQVLSPSNDTDQVENYQRDLFCYPANETILTMDDSIHSANEIVLNHNKRTIYFDNTIGDDMDDKYEKVVEYCPQPVENIQLFKDDFLPPPRCKSPMPPYKRNTSRIDRVMDEIIESRCRTPLKYETSSTSSESSVAITLDDPERNEPVFVEGDLTPLPRPRSPYPEYEATRVTRNESPAPRIHRKKYPVRFQDEDSEDSPPTPRRRSPSRCDSPFLRDNSPLPYPGKKSALKKHRDGSTSRSYTPVLRYNSSITSSYHVPILRAESPFGMSALDEKDLPNRCYSPGTPNTRQLPENSTPRCQSPVLKNTVSQSHDHQRSRCKPPLTRGGSLPRNDNPVPRCNSPFMRNNSPLPRNDNPVPRCNSPFTRNNSPLPRNENPTPRSNSPLMRNNNPLPRNDNPNSERYISPPLRGTTFSRPSSPLQKNPATRKQASSDERKFTTQSIPLTLHSSPTYTEKFIRGHFFSPDDEVINRSSVSPNCFVKLLDSINHRPGVAEHVCNYLKDACALAFAPASLVHQTMVKAADVNPLHGPDLSGQKVVGWYFDAAGDETGNMMSTIKRIKTRMSDARFTDVFLSALSASLESYFLRSGCDGSCIPETVSVVIPVRMASKEEIAETMALRDEQTRNTGSDNLETEENAAADGEPKIPAMENKFSVALLSLPITSMSTDAKLAKPFSPISRLREICKHTDILRKSPDYHINYWLMRVVSKYLPVPLLAPLLNSTQSTVVVSNLLGPPRQLWLGGYHLKDIAFWVPNRGSTGVGISVLSYSGRLQVGIVADRALIPCQQDANIIVEGIVSELKCLDEITAPVKTHPLTA